MQVYGLIGQTKKGIWPEAQLRDIYFPRSDQPVRNLHFARKAMFYLLYYTETKSFHPFNW
jgi:hypothetical protein